MNSLGPQLSDRGGTMKTKVSQNAVIKRINRKLDKQGERLKTTRMNSRDYSSLGRHYTIDISGNFVVGSNIDLETYARELGVLQKHEEVEE